MSGMRARLSWMLDGRQQVLPTLDAITADLQALQTKVAAMEAVVARLEGAIGSADAERLAELERIRHSVTTATDDLLARFDAWTAANGGRGPA